MVSTRALTLLSKLHLKEMLVEGGKVTSLALNVSLNTLKSRSSSQKLWLGVFSECGRRRSIEVMMER